MDGISFTLSLLLISMLSFQGGNAQKEPEANVQLNLPAGNCLQKLLVRSGVPLAKAITYKGTLASLHFDLPKIKAADEKLLAFILEKNLAHARAVQSCLKGDLPACHDYSPCGSEGQCEFSEERATYQCVCSPYRTGDFCQVDTSVERLTNAVDVVRGNAVKNAKKVTAVSKRVDVLEAYNAACNKALVGYAFNSRHHQFIGNNDHAQLASITYVKKRADTLLKVSYSANIRVLGGGSGRAARWFVKIDGQECSDPTLVDIWYFRTDTENIHIPANLKGICRGTSDGQIGTGSHTITVHVGESPIDNYPLGHTSSGYGSTQLLEVQEICPPF
ncbi:uncharacterized protein LOC135825787 [Sycon ciliatum]|uniref:uncharacterized protein LOC135825787 n=1 Tax=Sycon ciliatum TaxID=27933 RepID=UPI0031F70F86